MKKINNYPNYLVTDNGEIHSKKYSRLLKPRDNGNGYLQVCLSNSEGQRWFLVSRLVAHAFYSLDLEDKSKEVDHKDRNRGNNNPSNLQVLSKDEHLEKSLKDRGFNRQRPKKIMYRAEIDPVLLNNTLIEAGSWVQAAKIFYLSDNGLRKLYKRTNKVSTIPKIKHLKPM